MDLSIDYSPIVSSFRPQVDKQWAFRKSEHLAGLDWQSNADSIKALGLKYHIVTRQTSLLALEPGMTLWQDTLWLQQNNGTVSNSMSGAPVATDAASVMLGAAPQGSYSGSGSGLNVDSYSLEQLAGALAVGGSGIRAAKNDVAATLRGRTLQVTMPSVAPSERVAIRLFDARGRQILSKVVIGKDLAGGTLDLSMSSTLARGFYTLRVTSGATSTVLRVPVL